MQIKPRIFLGNLKKKLSAEIRTKLKAKRQRLQRQLDKDLKAAKDSSEARLGVLTADVDALKAQLGSVVSQLSSMATASKSL